MPRKGIRIPRQCPQCGTTFSVWPSTLAQGRGTFCSRACAALASRIPAVERFWRLVQKTDTCWLWTGKRTPNGYGYFSESHRHLVGAHRFAWILTNGAIPDGLWVLHRCDNPPCVRPEHLFLGTGVDNQADMRAKGRGLPPDQQWARRHPERVARGDASWSRSHPEQMARGERNGACLHPESLCRGEQVNTAKLTADQVRAIRVRHAAGASTAELARDYGVGQLAIQRIVARRTWKHIA